MKKYELTDRQLKIAFFLAVAIIGWLCLKDSGAIGDQNMTARVSHRPPAELSPNGW